MPIPFEGQMIPLVVDHREAGAGEEMAVPPKACQAGGEVSANASKGMRAIFPEQFIKGLNTKIYQNMRKSCGPTWVGRWTRGEGGYASKNALLWLSIEDPYTYS